jgi:peptidylprolyl isomerase
MMQRMSRIPSVVLTAFALLGCSHAQSSSESSRPLADAPQSPASVPPAVAPADALRTASGLRHMIVRGGGPGEPAGPNDKVVVRYTMRGTGGKIVARTTDDQPETIPMGSLPTGWAEGMTLLVPGDTATLWVPADLAYGDPLTIEVALVDIVRGRDVAKLPIAAPPADAKRTASGVAYVVIREGSGTAHPGVNDRIKAHYVGWTTDGKQFDSSYERGEPIDFTPTNVIKGWTEAIGLMVVGEKTRFWIPQQLAYEGKPGRPAGMLVFDIELIAFEATPSTTPSNP